MDRHPPFQLCRDWRFAVPGVKPWQQCAAFALMTLYVWVLPVGHTIAARHAAFFLLLLLTFWLALRGALRPRLPLLAPWLVFSGIALLSLPHAIDPAYSLGEIRSEIGYGMLALLLGASWVRDSAALAKLLAALFAGAAVMILAALANGFIFTPFWEQEKLAVTSLNCGVGAFSTYLVMVLPFLLARAWLAESTRRRLFLALAGAGLLALYLTGNRAGLLALALAGVIALGFALVHRRLAPERNTLAAIALAAAILGMGAFSHFSQRPLGTDPRGEIWRVAIQDIATEPLSGAGFGMAAFKLRNPDYVTAHPLHGHAHNMFLNKGEQMGVPGMVAFAALWLALLFRLRPVREMRREEWAYAVAASAMAGGMIAKNMSDDFFANDAALLFWLLSGAVIGARTRENEQR